MALKNCNVFHLTVFTRAWEFIKENKKVRKQEKKTKRTRPRKRSRKKENKEENKKVIKKKRKFFLFLSVVFLFLIAFLVEFFFSSLLSFFLDRFLGRVLFFFLAFFFSWSLSWSRAKKIWFLFISYQFQVNMPKRCKKNQKFDFIVPLITSHTSYSFFWFIFPEESIYIYLCSYRMSLKLFSLKNLSLMRNHQMFIYLFNSLHSCYFNICIKSNRFLSIVEKNVS